MSSVSRVITTGGRPAALTAASVAAAADQVGVAGPVVVAGPPGPRVTVVAPGAEPAALLRGVGHAGAPLFMWVRAGERSHPERAQRQLQALHASKATICVVLDRSPAGPPRALTGAELVECAWHPGSLLGQAAALHIPMADPYGPAAATAWVVMLALQGRVIGLPGPWLGPPLPPPDDAEAAAADRVLHANAALAAALAAPAGPVQAAVRQALAQRLVRLGEAWIVARNRRYLAGDRPRWSPSGHPA